MRFDLQLFGGGGGKGQKTSTSQYKMSPQEEKLANFATDFGTAASPIAIGLLSNQYTNSINGDVLGLQNQDYGSMLNAASSQIQAAQSNIGNLANGTLPTAYQDNLAAGIRSGVEKTVGSLVNGLGQRGVVNSSVTNKNLADIDASVANAMAQGYNQNLNTAANLAGQQISAATAPISTAAQAQQASLIAPNAALGQALQLNQGGVLQALNSLNRSGSTTSTQSESVNPWLAAASIGMKFL